jgi:hypothetical protein
LVHTPIPDWREIVDVASIVSLTVGVVGVGVAIALLPRIGTDGLAEHPTFRPLVKPVGPSASRKSGVPVGAAPEKILELYTVERQYTRHQGRMQIPKPTRTDIHDILQARLTGDHLTTTFELEDLSTDTNCYLPRASTGRCVKPVRQTFCCSGQKLP